MSDTANKTKETRKRKFNRQARKDGNGKYRGEKKVVRKPFSVLSQKLRDFGQLMVYMKDAVAEVPEVQFRDFQTFGRLVWRIFHQTYTAQDITDINKFTQYELGLFAHVIMNTAELHKIYPSQFQMHERTMRLTKAKLTFAFENIGKFQRAKYEANLLELCRYANKNERVKLMQHRTLFTKLLDYTGMNVAMIAAITSQTTQEHLQSFLQKGRPHVETLTKLTVFEEHSLRKCLTFYYHAYWMFMSLKTFRVRWSERPTQQSDVQVENVTFPGHQIYIYEKEKLHSYTVYIHVTLLPYFFIGMPGVNNYVYNKLDPTKPVSAIVELDMNRDTYFQARIKSSINGNNWTNIIASKLIVQPAYIKQQRFMSTWSSLQLPHCLGHLCLQYDDPFTSQCFVHSEKAQCSDTSV